MRFSLLLACLVFFGGAAFSTVSHASAFPAHIDLNEFSDSLVDASGVLELRGVSSRNFLFFSVYDVALYQNSDQSFPYLLSIRYSRSISKDRLVTALHEGIEKNSTESDRELLQDELNQQLSSRLADVKQGDELVLLRLGPALALAIHNGKSLGRITGAGFVTVLFQIWLGEHSVVDRGELIGHK